MPIGPGGHGSGGEGDEVAGCGVWSEEGAACVLLKEVDSLGVVCVDDPGGYECAQGLSGDVRADL